MKLGIMQPYFFPYIGYWQLINAVDEYVIYDDVNYIKRGWMNRNYILPDERRGGGKQRINIHIENASQNRLIKDTKLAQTKEDNRSLMNVIKQSYHKAPYFENVSKLVEGILSYPTADFTSFMTSQIKQVCRYLGIDTKIVLSSDIQKAPNLKGEAKIIEICKKKNADTYINAIGGKELYHYEKFAEEEMQLKFLQTGDIHYKQFDKDFVPYLSIIDVMMFNSVDEIKCLLDKYILE